MNESFSSAKKGFFHEPVQLHKALFADQKTIAGGRTPTVSVFHVYRPAGQRWILCDSPDSSEVPKGEEQETNSFFACYRRGINCLSTLTLFNQYFLWFQLYPAGIWQPPLPAMVVLGRQFMEKPQADGEHQVLSISYLASSFLIAGKSSPWASRELGVDRALLKRIIEFSMTLIK